MGTTGTVFTFNTNGVVFTPIILLLATSNAMIKTDGIWTDEDWYNEDQHIGIENGVPYSKDLAYHRQLMSPQPIEGDMRTEDYESAENVQRVMRILDSTEWEFLFPKRDDVYTFEGFLQAVAKFPYFCDENNTNMADDDMCKKELATMFAHFVVETGYNSKWLAENKNPASERIPLWRQALHEIENQGCAGNDGSNNGCNYYADDWTTEPEAWPNQGDAQYYARGPLQLAYNYNYGRFSSTFIDGGYNSGKLELLENPE
jgi:chitodextrinase